MKQTESKQLYLTFTKKLPQKLSEIEIRLRKEEKAGVY